MMVKKDSHFRSMDDLCKAKKLIHPSPEPTGQSSIAAVFAAEALGLDNLKVVYGYPGSAASVLAVIRGQADFYTPSLGTALRHLEELRPVLVLARKRLPELPDVPAIYEMPLRDEGKGMLEMVLNIWEIGRSVITTPGVPPERVRFLRGLFMKCVKDQEFAEKSKRLKRSLKILSGEEVEALLKKIMSFPAEDLPRFKHIIYEKYR